MRVKGLRSDPKFAWAIADEDIVEETLERHNNIEEEELVGAIKLMQEVYEEWGLNQYKDAIGVEGNLRRAIREKEQIYPLKEVNDYIIALSRSEEFNDEANTIASEYGETVAKAVLDHHTYCVEQELGEIENRLVEGEDSEEQFYVFNKPTDEPVKPKLPRLDYTYHKSGTPIEIDARWAFNGESGILQFESEIRADLDNISFELTVHDLESNNNHGLVKIAEIEEDIEPDKHLRSFNVINKIVDSYSLSKEQQASLLCQVSHEHVWENQSSYYEQAVQEGLTCEKCDTTQNKEDGVYVISNEESNPFSQLFDQICTECVAGFLSNQSILSERQARVFALRQMGFSHSRIADEINKRIEDEEDHIQRGAVSGATSQISDKVDRAKTIMNFVADYKI